MKAFELFSSIGEPFAAGLFEFEDASPLVRYANALKRFWENAEMAPYDGGMLYPCGENVFTYDKSLGAVPHYCNTLVLRTDVLKAKSEEAYQLMYQEKSRVAEFHFSPHTVGGMGWTHSFPNYARVLAEGLDRYRERVEALEEGDFRQGLMILLEGIDACHARCLELLRNNNAPRELISALEKMPYKPAETAYEAMVSLNFTYYIDGCDDIGPLDRLLLPYHRGEDLVPLLREYFKHVDENDGWSGTLGPEYNDITRMCIHAIHNGRRPNLQLLVKPDMPDWVWEESAASLATSCGQPALYNYDLYQKTLHEFMPEIPEEDLKRMAFGGCTETMLEGISAVGSDDAGINVALIFAEYMQETLPRCESYEEFFDGLVQAIRKAVAETLDLLNEYRRTRALYRPSMVRTLLVEDCIEKRQEFNAGGTRWMWSCVNMAGTVNVIDSLNVIRTMVYEEPRYSAEEFLEKLNARDEEFLALAAKCPSYGNDDVRADEVGTALINAVADAFSQRECFPRGKFYPVSNQFTTYVDAGKGVSATPDGRCCGAPLCDSLGAIHGNDTKGPTALLSSVSKLPLSRVIGTPITNIRISKKNLPLTLKPLVNGFFRMGGMELQVSCLSREEILDAMAHPEKHRSLVVRIGGFSEYFIRLSSEMQQTVLERTEY